MARYVAIDLGAESGRVIGATLEGGRLSLEEIYRFPNGAVQVGERLYWDVLGLWQEIKRGLRKAAAQGGANFRSLAVDTWGVDYALLDRRGQLVGNPHSYRDPRTNGMMERALEQMTRWDIYRESGGIQFLTINTLYQMMGMVAEGDPAAEIARTFLMIPDLFNYWLTGRIGCEFSNATTTQFYNGPAGEWARGLLGRLGLPTDIYPSIVMPGTCLGDLLPGVAEETGLPRLPVVVPATHDTASAAAAVPAARPDFAWLSSGTWSLLGGSSQAAFVSEEALSYNISSYGGAGGAFVPWKNIMGLWLVQECRRAWTHEGEELSYHALTEMARAARPFVAVLDPDDPSFLAPKDMPAAIAAYCARMGQPAPESRGEMVRAVLESLALRYRWTMERLGRLHGAPYPVLHVVGGGSRNGLLCQLTADATGVPVIAGPVEATALGNAALQAVAMGDLTLDEARQVIRDSFDVITYDPRDRGGWDEAYAKFERLLET